MEDPVLYDIQNIFHFKIYLGTASIRIPLCDTNAHIYTSRPHPCHVFYAMCILQYMFMFMKAEKDRNVKSHSSTHGSTRVVPIDLGGR